jgi:hypothetical protein
MIRGLAILGAYVGWIAIFRLLMTTLITYFVMSAGHRPRFEEVNEAISANELGIMGLGAILFSILFPLLNPLTSTRFQEICTAERFEKKFLPGFAQGAILASAVILAFVISGLYRYLGFFVQFEDTPLAVVNVAIRTLSIGALVYCEEFLFRHKIYGHMLQWRARLWPGAGLTALSLDLGLLTLVSLSYCAVKSFQFDVGLMHWITLFLVSLSLTLRTRTEGDFAHGAGFWAALLIVFHPLLGLPVFGNDFSGLLLVKYQSANPAAELEGTTSTLRFLSGGPGGPISAFALQLLLVLDIARGIVRYKKSLLNPSPAR